VRRPTIYDVAHKAGVGIGTVSRVMNNSPRVGAETRERVLAAIKELNFKPDTIARQLPRRTRRRNIGVLTQPFISYHSFAERLRGIQAALSAQAPDYEVVLYSAGSPQHAQEQLQTITQESTVEGLIVIDFVLPQDQHDLLVQANIAVVSIHNRDTPYMLSVGTDDRHGGRLATQHLLDLGHTHIAYVGDHFVQDDFGFKTSEERYRGYTDALSATQIVQQPGYVRLGDYGYEAARDMARQLIQLATPPTAIFAMSDMQAIGCMAAAREMTLSIPQDISIIGYDDLEIAAHMGLTTIRQHLQRSGQHAVQYLLNRSHDPDVPPPAALPPLQVITRTTTTHIHTSSPR
jgi:DNA-binding LacI/PurR family transcriptional regulator